MTDVKRSRGRPKGSQINDDTPLMAVARLLADNPKLAPKTAARRVFKASGRAACFEDASIHRWQGKWKTDKAVYLQRVTEERSEVERQQQERAATQGYLSGLRQARELAIGIGALSHLVPRQAVGEAVFGILHQHRDLAQAFGGAIAGLAGRGMLPAQSSAFDVLARSKAVETMMGPAIGDAMRMHKTVMDNFRLGDAMRKHGEIGRALAESGGLGILAKLPSGI